MRQRLVRVLFVGLVLAVVVSGLLVPVQSVSAQSIVDSNIGSAQYFNPGYNTKSFYANSRQWVFYRDGSNFVYRSSVDDGTTWSGEVIVHAGNPSLNPTVVFDGVYGHYFLVMAGTDSYYRRFVPESDGTLTYSAAETHVVGVTPVPSNQPVGLAVDSNGYPWICYYNNHDIYVVKSSTSDGTWTTEVGWPQIISAGVGGNGVVAIYALTSGRMAAMYSTTTSATSIWVKRWTGSGWGTAVASPTDHYQWYDVGATTQDDNLHVVWQYRYSTYGIRYAKYQYSTNTFVNAATLASSAPAGTNPAIGIDSTTNNIHVFWLDGTSDIMYYKRLFASDSTWSDTVQVLTDIDNPPAASYFTHCHANPSEVGMGVFYISGTAILKFKWLGEPFVVSTLPADGINNIYATLRGSIDSLGFGPADMRGFYVGLTGPSADYYVAENGTFNTGAYYLGIWGLTPSTMYWFQAFAMNEFGEATGNWTTFTTGSTGAIEGEVGGPGGTQCYIPITVSNNSTASYTNMRITYQVNAASLIAGGYLRSDALDSFLADGTTILYHDALGLTSNNVTWMGRVPSIPAYWSNELRLWVKNPAITTARNQTWESFSGDTITVNQSVSTNLTNNLTLDAIFSLDDSVAATRYLVNKPNAYWLGVNGTALQGGVYTSGGAMNVTYTSIPLTTVNQARMTYVSGTGIRLYLGGILVQTLAVTGSIDTSEDNLSVLGINGTVDELAVGNLTSGTFVLRYSFEPTQISTTQIADQTGSGNNANYVLGQSMPGWVTTTLGGIVCTGDYVPPGGGSLIPTPAANEPPSVIPLPTSSGAPLTGTAGSTDCTHLPLCPLVQRAATSYGWNVMVMYAALAFIFATAFAVAATVGTGSLLWGGATGAGVLAIAGAASIIDWWIPLILGLVVVMIVALVRA